METIRKSIWKAWRAGGWAPVLVFSIHAFLGGFLNLYDYWPSFDVPMHFLGGLSIAYFVSQSFQALPRREFNTTRLIMLELLLILAVTSTAAVVWEFAEFTIDQVLALNVQISLANTMQDMALGVAGACALILIRMRQLRVGYQHVFAFAEEWASNSADTNSHG